MTGRVRPRGLGAGRTRMFLTIFLLRIIKTEHRTDRLIHYTIEDPPPTRQIKQHIKLKSIGR